MLLRRSTPIRPITGRHWLSPSSPTRTPIGLPYGSLSLAGGIRAYRVPFACQSGLGSPSPPVAFSSAMRDLRTRIPATYLLVRAYEHLRLVYYHGVYQEFTCVSHTTQP